MLRETRHLSLPARPASLNSARCKRNDYPPIVELYGIGDDDALARLNLTRGYAHVDSFCTIGSRLKRRARILQTP
jgi:hypothetical protein